GLIMHWYGFSVAILTCGALFLLAGILAHAFIHEDFVPPPPEEKISFQSSWSGLSLAVWLSFCVILLMAVSRRFDEPYVPLMVERIHGPENTALHTGWISALAAFGGVLSGVILGKLCDRFSPQRVTVPVLVLCAVTMFLQSLAPTLAFFAAFRFANFLAAGGLEAGMLAILSRITPQERRGAIFGLSSSIRMSGVLVSSLISGGIIYWTGVRNIYVVSGVLFLLTIPVFGLAVARIKKERIMNNE
nr:MFS transporter [Thermoguttaceae bacterium]